MPPLPPLLSGHRSIQRRNFPHWGEREHSDGSIHSGSVSGRWRPKGAAAAVCPRQTETAAAVDRHPDGQTDPLGSSSLRSSARKPHSAPRRRVTFSRIWLGGLLLPSWAAGDLGVSSHDTGRLGTRCREKSIKAIKVNIIDSKMISKGSNQLHARFVCIFINVLPTQNTTSSIIM